MSGRPTLERLDGDRVRLTLDSVQHTLSKPAFLRLVQESLRVLESLKYSEAIAREAEERAQLAAAEATAAAVRERQTLTTAVLVGAATTARGRRAITRLAGTIRTPRGRRLTPRQYVSLVNRTTRLHACLHGHFDCALWAGGPCANEQAFRADTEPAEAPAAGKGGAS